MLAASLGCQTSSSLYEWGDYEADLYNAYRSPDEEYKFEESLIVIMERAQKKGTRVPPGIYAEYAYQLFEDNKLDAAVAYLEKERAAWPESSALMVRLIAAVHREEERRERGGDPDAPLAWAVDPSEEIADDAAPPPDDAKPLPDESVDAAPNEATP